jgi:CBS domain-containing protein
MGRDPSHGKWDESANERYSMPTAQLILDKKGSDVATIDRNATVVEAAAMMNAKKIGALVVSDGDKIVGIFTERDILIRVVAAEKVSSEKVPWKIRVGDVMTSPMACCRRDTPLEECRAVMSHKRIRHLPVVEEGRLYGIISSGDILAFEVANQQNTIEYLHEYLYGRT